MKKFNLKVVVVLWIVVFCLPVLAATAVSGWPIKGTDGYYRTFAVGDVLSASPGKEALVITTGNRLIIYSNTGSKLGEYSFTDLVYQAPTLADFNDDGLLEIVVAPYNELHRIEDGVASTIYTGNGSVVYRPVVVEDLNEDESLETTYITGIAEIYVHDSSGNVLPGWPQQPYARTGAPLILHSSLAVGDLDKDGISEIVVQIFNSPDFVTTGAPTIFAFNLDGSIKWQRTISPNYVNYSQSSNDILWFNDVVLGDVDNDSYLETVYFRHATNGEGAAGFVYILDHEGNIQSEWSIPYTIPGLTFSATMSQIALGDLDNDRDLEIVVAGRSYSDSSQAPIFAWHHTSEMVAGFPANVPEIDGATDRIIAPMLVDADGDGAIDIVSSLYSLRNNYYNRIYAWDAQGELLPDWPKELVRVYSQNIIALTPWNQSTIDDLDGDGTLDLIAPIGSAEAHAIDLVESECIAWPTFRHDVGRTGRYDPTWQADTCATAAPTHASLVYLPMILNPLSLGFDPIFIGAPILQRDVINIGETFYLNTIQVPDQIPATGTFYLSARSDKLSPVLVDDALSMKVNGNVIFSHDFSTNGTPQSALLSIPRDVMEQMAGQTVAVEYYDIYGKAVMASEMWLIWVP